MGGVLIGTFQQKPFKRELFYRSCTNLKDLFPFTSTSDNLLVAPNLVQIQSKNRIQGKIKKNGNKEDSKFRLSPFGAWIMVRNMAMVNESKPHKP